MKIGRNIRRFRQEKGYSQENMARDLGMSQNNFSKIEKDEINISVERLYQIANLLDKDPQELLSNADIYFHNISNNQKGGNNIVLNDGEHFEKERALFLNIIAAKEEIIKSKEQQITLLYSVLNSAKEKN